MEVKAEAKYIRISPRKVRLVVDAIRGLTPQKALEYLKFIKRSLSGIVANVPEWTNLPPMYIDQDVPSLMIL